MSSRSDGLIMNSFYIVKLSSEDEEFYKIGVSSATDEEMLSARRLSFIREQASYKIEILHFIKCNGHSRVEDFEKTLLALLGDFSYEPKVNFEGFSECFKDYPIELLRDESTTIFTSHLKPVEDWLQKIRQRKDDWFGKIFDLNLFKWDLAECLRILGLYNELVEIFQFKAYQINEFSIEPVRTRIKEAIFPEIEKIRSAGIGEIKEYRNKIAHLEAELRKLNSRNLTKGDVDPVAKIAAELGYKPKDKSYLNEKISDKERAKLIEETKDQIANILHYIDAYLSKSLEELKEHEHYLKQILRKEVNTTQI